MAKKTVGYVKLAWTCDRCEMENPGPRRFCNACGAPQPEEVEFHQPAQEVFLTKPEEVTAAQAGADIHCPYCNARNPAQAAFCGACGGSLEEGRKRSAGRVMGAHRSAEALPVPCPSCGTRNPAGALECAGCGDSLAPARRPVQDERPAMVSKPAKLPLGLILGAVLCISLGALLFALFGRTQETPATVSSVSWRRSIPIEVLGEVEAEAWLDEIPMEAEIRSCREAYRYTQDQPAPNAIEVCGTPYTIDQGSGYGEVVQDCVYEVYDQLCSFTILDWVLFDTVTTSGADLAPYWPELSLTADQRYGEGEERYQVTFSGPDGTYTYSPGSESEYSRFAPGSTWTLEVNAAGGVISVTPAR